MPFCTPACLNWAAQEGYFCPGTLSDWERISVVACPEDPPDLASEQQTGSRHDASSPAGQGRVVAAVLSQHDHDELIQCTGAQGCEFENEHLLVYVGLNSHANFAHASNGTIYGGVRNDQKHYTSSSGGSSASKGGDGKPGKMEGVVLLDRTAKGAKWVPTLTNLAPLPRKQQTKEDGQGSVKQGGKKAAWRLLGSRPLGKKNGDGDKDGVLKGALAADDEDAWAFYPGFW
eukprot:1156860-Pelagomonas_calceolata.AAC.10